MRYFEGTYQKPITHDVGFNTYRDDNGAWLTIHFEGREIRCELSDEVAREMGEALIGISKALP